MNFSSESPGCMVVGRSLAKSLDDACLIEGEKTDLESEEYTFLRNRLSEIIAGTVCRLLEGHRVVTDSYPGSTKKKSC